MAFEKLDVNGDGYLTKEELKGVLTQNKDSFEKLRNAKGMLAQIDLFIAANDIDGNDQISLEEFENSMWKFAVDQSPEKTGDKPE